MPGRSSHRSAARSPSLFVVARRYESSLFEIGLSPYSWLHLRRAAEGSRLVVMPLLTAGKKISESVACDPKFRARHQFGGRRPGQAAKRSNVSAAWRPWTAAGEIEARASSVRRTLVSPFALGSDDETGLDVCSDFMKPEGSPRLTVTSAKAAIPSVHRLRHARQNRLRQGSPQFAQ